MVEKYKLNLAVAFTIILVSIWLIWARMNFVGRPLLMGAFVLVIWTLIRKEKTPAKLLEFFVKSLVVCYVTTSIIWFVWMRITSPWYYSYFILERIISTLVAVVLPLSLFPVAVSVIIYGIFRIKLKASEIFLSLWYASIFTGLIYYSVWYYLNINPYQPAISDIGEAIVLAFICAFLTFPIAGILAIIYLIVKK